MRYATLSNDGIVELPEAGKFEVALTGILRNGARRLLRTAVAGPGWDNRVHVRADGVYRGLRSGDAKRCCLVVIGVDDKGRKSMPAMGTGCASPPWAGRTCCWTSRTGA